MRLGVSFGVRLETNYHDMARPHCIGQGGTITLDPASSPLPSVWHKVGMLAATQALTHPLVCPQWETCGFNLWSAAPRQETLSLSDNFGKGDIFWHIKIALLMTSRKEGVRRIKLMSDHRFLYKVDTLPCYKRLPYSLRWLVFSIQYTRIKHRIRYFPSCQGLFFKFYKRVWYFIFWLWQQNIEAHMTFSFEKQTPVANNINQVKSHIII